MLALPHLSADEVVATLERLGFRTEARANGLAKMSRSSRSVAVPETATLSPSLLGAILRAADVEPFDFVCAIRSTAQGHPWRDGSVWPVSEGQPPRRAII